MDYKDNQIGFRKPANKTAEGTDQPIVINEITVRPINRQSQDLTNWRNATRAAEATIPRRTTLYDLYADIMSTDGHVISVWGKRVDAVTNADWQFVDKEGNSIDEINDLIDCIGFEDLVTAIMDTKAWGYTMVEPKFFVNPNGENEFSTYVVPRKHTHPEKGIIAKEQSGSTGINVREGIYAKTIMEFGKTNDLGLLLSACQYAILKRGDISDWAEFIEIFGRGIIDATWDGFDEDQRNKLSEAIEQMGGGGVIIHPDGTKIDINNTTGTANGDLQEKFASFCNKEISKALLGSTETTESSTSSGYAQSETHQEQDDDKHVTDITYVRRYLNSRFRSVLKAAGFDTKGGKFRIKERKEILSKKDAFEIHKSLAKDLELPIDDDFFYEEYGMPKPKDYEKKKKAIEEAKKADFEQKQALEIANTPPSSKDKNNKKPKALEGEKVKKLVRFSDEDLSFLKRIRSFFD